MFNINVSSHPFHSALWVFKVLKKANDTVGELINSDMLLGQLGETVNNKGGANKSFLFDRCHFTLFKHIEYHIINTIIKETYFQYHKPSLLVSCLEGKMWKVSFFFFPSL